MDRYRTIISALLAAISYQYFWPGIFVSLIPMLSQKLSKRTFVIWGISYMSMLHLFLLTLSDDSHIIAAILLWLIAGLYFGLFYGFGGWVLIKVSEKLKQPWPFLLPFIWPLIEYTKSLGSFGNPNGNIGFSLSSIASSIPIYSVIGHIGVGIFIICINVLLHEWIKTKQKKHIGIIIGILIGMVSINSPNTFTKGNPPISVIQTDIPQQQKINPSTWPTLEKNILNQINEATGNILILPETILPTDIKQRPLFNTLQDISHHRNIAILVGSFIHQNSTYNGSYFIQPNKPTIDYKKQRLMPFGETLPLRSILGAFIPNDLLFNDFQTGDSSIDIPLGENLHLRPLICLEGIYGHFYRSESNSIIAILANNAWFNNSTAGSKLLKFAQVHAAEFQTSVLLSTNFGQSAIISPTGALIQSAKHQNAAILTHTIQSRSTPSIYHQWPWAGCLVLLMGWISLIRWQTI